MSQFSKSIRNDFKEFARANEAIEKWLASSGIAAEVVRTVSLGLEEVVTNIIKYGYDDRQEHEIEIALSVSEADLQLLVTDDGHEFNPLNQPEPNTAKPAEDREPGGLGIWFLRKLFDDLHYERREQQNCLTLRKRLAH